MKVLIFLCLVAGVFARSTPDCPENSHYEQCGLSCPLTCDNYDDPPPCVPMCHRGCQCDQGYVLDSEENCIPIDDCPVPEEGSSCNGDDETGMCRGLFPKWFFDKVSGTCKEFIYGGCGGNGNRHATEEACYNKCVLKGREPHQNPLCDLPAATGQCRAGFRRYYFDAETGQCEQFGWGGCRGNANNFRTVEECQKTCGDPEEEIDIP